MSPCPGSRYRISPPEFSLAPAGCGYRRVGVIGHSRPLLGALGRRPRDGPSWGASTVLGAWWGELGAGLQDRCSW